MPIVSGCGRAQRMQCAWRPGARLSAWIAGAIVLASCADGGHRGATLSPPVSAPACADVRFPIYFAENSNQLTDPARQALGVAAAQVRACHIAYVSVIGLTDSVGLAKDNIELSRQRATAVAQALAAAGLPTPKFEVRGLGEAGATTKSGNPVPLRRRTDVVIHVTP